MESHSIPIEAYFCRPMTAIGVSAMEQISLMHVVIVGLRGCGMEIAKCLAHSGIQRLTLMDEELVRDEDLALGFLLRDGDQGKTKANLIASRLNELVPFADVRTLKGSLSVDLLLNFHVVVFASTSLSLEEIIAYDEFCRAQDPPIGVVVTESRGLFGSVFTDFSSEHQSLNTTPGNADVEFSVINKRTQVHDDGHVDRVTVVVKEPLLKVFIEEGDHVTLHQSGDITDDPLVLVVEKIISTNSVQLRPIDTTNGRREIQTKLHSQYSSLRRVGSRVFTSAHRSLRECLLSPGLLTMPMVHGGDMVRGNSLHMSSIAVHLFRREFGIMPNNNFDHIKFMLSQIDDHLAKNTSFERRSESNAPSICRNDVAAALVTRALRCASLEFLPLSALIAGHAALQVLKFSGALGPLLYPCSQYLYFDVIDLVNDDPTPKSMVGSPCDTALSVIFGSDLLERLRDVQLTFVGGGSTNVEVLKNIRCCGFGSTTIRFVLDPEECANVQADDLHECVLFTPNNVGHSKVSVFKNLWKVSVIDHPEVEDLSALSWGIWTASSAVVVDVACAQSVFAIDTGCRVYEKPMLLTYEDGFGLKTTDVVMPYSTATFNERFVSAEAKGTSGVFLFDHIPTSSQPGDANRNNQHLLSSERTVHCACRCFELMFQTAINIAVRYASSSAVNENDDGLKDEDSQLWIVWSVAQRAHGVDSFTDCLRVAWLLLELLPMWLGTSQVVISKRSHGIDDEEQLHRTEPSALLEIDASDPDHIQLLVATACIVAVSVGIGVPPVESRRLALAQVITNVEAFSLHFHRRTSSSIRASFADIDASQLQAIVSRVQQTQLDLDDPNKGHLHFLQSLVNLQLAWSEGRRFRIATLPHLRRLCRANRGFLPTTTILGALKTLQLLQILMHRGSDRLSASDLYEYGASSLATGSHVVQIIRHPPAPLVAKSMPHEVTRGVRLRVVPDNLSRWTKINVPTSAVLQSVRAIVQYIETKYQITVHTIRHHERCIATVDAQTKLALDGPLTQTVFDLCDSFAPFVVLEVAAVDPRGDVVVAPLRVDRKA